jgi:hypothetical protein
MPVKISPRRLRGPWIEGYALDLHTISSTMIGYNQYGHPEFDCKRLHRLGGGGQVRDGEWAGRPPMQPRGERNRREAAGYGD